MIAVKNNPDIVIRRAHQGDVAAVVQLFDDAIVWFVRIGNIGQWGSEPWSASPQPIERIARECALPEAWVAEKSSIDVCGAMILGDAMSYVQPACQAELYVRMLIASRDKEARGTGRKLLEFADERARTVGVNQLRVDCYGGGSGDLVRFYEACGYQSVTTFDVDGWPGQLLSRTI